MSRYDILLNDPKKQEPLPKAPGATPSPPLGRPTERPPDQAAVRRADRPAGKRLLVRRGFEWYEDQLAALKKLSLREQMAGKPGSMSQMVREAVDAYLRKRASEA